ncbi:MAG: bifunctional 4-hydroxy-2-oxoglutarate aldolase/2-dehydro-3-deoxy-phosphogluconate aldolase [Verrucomicrobiales bacterium]
MIQKIAAKRIVPVVVLDDEEDAEPLAEALLAGGLDVIEITFRTPAAEAAIQRITHAFPEVLVGAGTLLEWDHVTRAHAAGATFGLAPGLNPTVVQRAHELKLTFCPGIMTPSDVEAALRLGCHVLKFFPAMAAGGPAMLKALAGPYAHTGVKFIPTGGIHQGNLHEFLQLPAVAAIGGSWMVERKLIAAGDWKEITRRTAEALASVSSNFD